MERGKVMRAYEDGWMDEWTDGWVVKRERLHLDLDEEM